MMGSGASKNIKPMTKTDQAHSISTTPTATTSESDAAAGAVRVNHIDESDYSEETVSKTELPGSLKRKAFKQKGKSHSVDVNPRSKRLSDAEEGAHAAEERAKILEIELTEAEKKNLELLDQIQTLENEAEFLRREQEERGENVEADQETCHETVRIKDQTIQKLEREIEDMKIETDRLIIRYKKKLKLMKKQLAEQKQMHSLQLFEAKQQTEQLREQASTPAPNQDPVSKTPDQGQAEDGDDGRTRIILELSGRISEQDMEISRLQSQLQDRDKTIAGLEEAAKQRGKCDANTQDNCEDTEDWSPREEKELCSAEHNSFSPLRLNSGKNRASMKPPLPTNSTLSNAFASSSNANGDDMNELQSIAEEMRKIQQANCRKKRRSRPDRGNDHASGREEKRSSSGKSVDSGVISESEDDNLQMSPTLNTGQLDVEVSSECNTGRSTSSLDPSNIRQISAAKMRRKGRSSGDVETQRMDKKVTLQRTPSKKSARDNFMDEVDTLIQSIDEDVLSGSNSAKSSPVHSLPAL